MPYHVDSEHEKCPASRPHAVVKDDDGKVMGCHSSEGKADRQIAALNANESGAAEAMEVATDLPRWRGVLVLEGVETDDGRLIEAGALEWRDLPIPLMSMVETGPGGHEGARLAGRIDKIERVGAEVIGEGVFDSGEWGHETARLVGEEMLRGVSVDLAIREFETQGEDGEPAEMDGGESRVVFAVTSASIMGATVCPFPAFADASIALLADGHAVYEFGRIELVHEEDSAACVLIAAAVPVHPPSEWFDDPLLGGPTALEITDGGRVYGHAALFDTCHIADPQGAGVCVSPPRSRSGYSYFHLGTIETEDAGRVSVGSITLNTGHAPLKAGLAAASQHYDDTGCAVADVRVGEDVFGIWVAGALRSDVTPGRVRELSAAKISGDWRGMRGSLELVGLLAVNVPGFPVPRVAARVASGAVEEQDERLALVAAGIVDETPAEVPVTSSVKVLAARARGGVAELARLARGD